MMADLRDFTTQNKLDRRHTDSRPIRKDKLSIVHLNATIRIVRDQEVSIEIRVIDQRRQMRRCRDGD